MRNYVKKNMDQIHKPRTHTNRKAAGKRGHVKHKGQANHCRYCHDAIDLAPQPGQPHDVCDYCFNPRNN